MTSQYGDVYLRRKASSACAFLFAHVISYGTVSWHNHLLSSKWIVTNPAQYGIIIRYRIIYSVYLAKARQAGPSGVVTRRSPTAIRTDWGHDRVVPVGRIDPSRGRIDYKVWGAIKGDNIETVVVRRTTATACSSSPG